MAVFILCWWLLLTGLGAWLFRRHAWNPARSRVEVPICEPCGYDLRGLPGRSRCPECGAAERRRLDRSGRSWRHATRTLIGAGIAGALVAIIQTHRGGMPLLSMGNLEALALLVLMLAGAFVVAVCAVPLLFLHRATLLLRVSCVVSNVVVPCAMIAWLWSPSVLATDALAGVASMIGTFLVTLTAFALLPFGFLIALVASAFAAPARVRQGDAGDTRPPAGES